MIGTGNPKNQAVGVDHKGIAEGLPELFLVDAGHQIYEVVDAFELAHPDAQTRIVPFEGYQKPAHWLIRPQCKPKHHRAGSKTYKRQSWTSAWISSLLLGLRILISF